MIFPEAWLDDDKRRDGIIRKHMPLDFDGVSCVAAINDELEVISMRRKRDRQRERTIFAEDDALVTMSVPLDLDAEVVLSSWCFEDFEHGAQSAADGDEVAFPISGITIHRMR